MSKIQIIIDSIAGAVGAVLGFMYGEVTGLFWALIAFMALDYITGVVVAIIEKRLSSEVGFRGLAKKFLILVFVAVGHIADTYIHTRWNACRNVGRDVVLHGKRGYQHYRECRRTGASGAEEAERYNGSAEEGKRKRGRIIC